MPKIYRWIYNNSDSAEISNKIQKLYNLNRPVAETLAKRIKIDEVLRFLKPDLNDLHDPFLLSGMKEAYMLINEHISLNHKITIYGDYDVDGITSTVILYKTLKKLGADVEYYIPERLTEGYGINSDAIDKIASNGTKLIITVDCGITSVNEVLKAKKLGIDVIITDHHSVPDIIPEASVVINPHIKPSSYPFSDLAGVGVTFKLCMAFIGKNAYDFLDIVCLGSLADIVPLTGENRIIVKYGLDLLNKTKNKGLNALINVSNLNNVSIDEYHVGYILAPRLNAAGRLKSATLCVKLLLTDDENEADEIAAYLNAENIKRQEIEKQILDEAIKKVEETVDLKREKIIVLYSENWHPGVIGIVASKITERYSRPSILLSVQDGIGKGSGRSIKGFNLYEAIDYCSDCLIRYGGHEMAAGITIDINSISDFRTRINEYANKKLTEIDLIPFLVIDADLKDEDIEIETARQIRMLKPFGNGNPCPLFRLSNMTVYKVFNAGGDKHLKIIAEKNGKRYEMIAFGMGMDKDKIKTGCSIDVVGSIELNTWNGIDSVVINVKDIRIKHKFILYYINLGKLINNYSINVNRKYLGIEGLNLIDNRGINNKCEYVLKLFKTRERSVILVNTVEQMRALIKYLKIKEFRDFMLCNKYCENERLIIFSPNINDNLSYYKNIVFYDIPFNKYYFYNILLSCNNSNIHLIFNFNDISSNLKSIDEIVPRRSDFIRLFRFIDDDGTTILFKDQIYNQLKINPIKVIYCIKAMKEMGLINVKESDNIFMLSKNSVTGKVNIAQSEVIRQLYFVKNEFVKFAKDVISQNIKEVL